MRRIAVLDAPSNLGLRPPTPTSVPGCGKAPGALRDHDLVGRLGARDSGCLTPPRYDPGDWRPGDGVCHAPAIATYSLALADRIGAIIDQGEFPLVLGCDCSILLGSALAMHRLGEAVGGRIGLVFVDGHSDFRHPGNASYVGAAAGEDLALVTGRGQTDLTAIEGRRPYFRDIDVVVLGIRSQDEYRLDLQAAGIVTRPVPLLRAEGAARSAQWAHEQLADCAGYWVHVDVDVLDPAVMPAVDAPDAGGIAFPELELLLAGLVDTPHCLGVELTVFDPDYDPDGAYAAEIVSTLVAGLAPVYAPTPVMPSIGRASVPASSLARSPAASASLTNSAGSAGSVGGTAGGRPGASESGGNRPEPLAVPAAITVPERLARRRRLASGNSGARAAGRVHDDTAAQRPSPVPAPAGPLPPEAVPVPARPVSPPPVPAPAGSVTPSPVPAPAGPVTPSPVPAPAGPVSPGAAPAARPQRGDARPGGRLAARQPGEVEPVGPPASAGPGRLRPRQAVAESAVPREELSVPAVAMPTTSSGASAAVQPAVQPAVPSEAKPGAQPEARPEDFHAGKDPDSTIEIA